MKNRRAWLAPERWLLTYLIHLKCQIGRHHAIFTSDRRPGRGTLLTILLAISSDAVAAGEGALQTWREFLPSSSRKSSTKLPSRSRACARTPLLLGMRSSAWTSGTRRWRLRVKAALLKER